MWELNNNDDDNNNNNNNIVQGFLFADYIKIVRTLNMQLKLLFHNPTWIPFAVGVLLTPYWNSNILTFTRKINKIKHI